MGDEGTRALKGLTALTSLNLFSNQIGDEGAQALKGLTALTSLELGFNHIADISPLVSLRNLRDINLSGNHLNQVVPSFWMLPSLQEAFLHYASLPNVPVEVLSKHGFDNCLDRLRAHLKDLTGDDVAVGDVKLMILGNGRVGKTQICRRLRGESFDEAVPSTHGIQVSSVPLTPPANDRVFVRFLAGIIRGWQRVLSRRIFDAPVTLKIWDFGGQDIYHGTHALFLKSRAVFPVVWTPKSEAEQFHTHAGFTFRNQPLAYWLAYLRTFGGERSPVLVIQSQCDRHEDERDPPLPQGALDGFGYKKVLHYSAKGDGTNPRGHAGLVETLLDAVQWMRRNEGVAKIGPGRAAVKEALEAKLAAGQRLISHQGLSRPMRQGRAHKKRPGHRRRPAARLSRSDDETQKRLKLVWDEASPEVEAVLTFDLLPPGLMRALIARIGSDAGLAAEYWRDGVCFYDERTASRALIAQRWTEGWAGEVHIATKRGHASVLLRRLIGLVKNDRISLGARPSGMKVTGVEVKAEAREAFDTRAAEVPVRPAHEPSNVLEYYVSYAWGDDTEEGKEREAVVDRLSSEAEARSKRIIRDKTAMKSGNRISTFMDRIGKGAVNGRVCIVLSDKYLKSPYCMHELFDVWRYCREDPETFIDRTRVLVLPTAKISTAVERAQYVIHWQRAFKVVDALVKEHGQFVLSDNDNAEFRLMSRFVSETANILQLVQDTLRPRSFDDYVNHVFD
jgi:GTPase SAR1 family protein